MISNATFVEDKSAYSELKVLRSAAGFYVGTTYSRDGVEEPGSRDSGYFATYDAAERFLNMLRTVNNPQEYLRDAP